ncbi:hypothetical protein BCR44DRAFT_1422842 [Catenaria anguillulae PL171]|uniref:tRNA (guanine(10)-N(2))-methyltransferase TRMT11 N-terminal domain-containing protein n=1 Tax=Catenaria anguillulae PL171 TaxID=765915 RepID=A0A1Y2I7F6_9FUNG|nr:hypothetical protein BCR44DRAFT_1422842 [Catenaria anguillulae PL171]
MQTSFKFTVDSFNLSQTQQDKVKIINSFSFLDYKGKIDLRTPDVTFGVLEAWTPPPGTPQLTHVYFGTLVGDGDRKSIDAFNLKRRKYLGTTSMDPELSLIMGTWRSSSAAHSCTTRSARQSDKPGTVSVFSNIDQYGVHDKVVGCMVFDLAHHGWRTDRPLWTPLSRIRHMAYYTPKHDMGRFPATVPYDLDAVMIDLTEFAAKMLVVGGRISYWLPTVKEEYHPSDVPLHPALKLVSNCEQPFGQWSRRLITLEKVADWQPGMHATGSGLLGAKLDTMGAAGAEAMESALANAAAGKKKGNGGDQAQKPKEPGHKGFREKYFAFSSTRRDESQSPQPDAQ